MQLGAIPAATTGALFEHALAARLLEGTELEGVRLLIALADTGVADEMGLRRNWLAETQAFARCTK
jgi:hypothetical protein